MGSQWSGGLWRLVKPEGRALIVAAQLEAPESGFGALVPLDVHVLDRASQLPNLFESRVHVVNAEEDVGRGTSVTTCIPPGTRVSLTM